MSELKECPFCGNEPMKTANHTILCETCHREVLPETWNTRPVEDGLRAEITRLQEYIRALEANTSKSVVKRVKLQTIERMK